MNKKLLIFTAVACVIALPVMAAVNIKKAAPVAKQTQTASTSVAGMLPSIVNFIGQVQDINAKQKALTAECVPTSQEITFVNEIIQEWARTGAMTATEAQNKVGIKNCTTTTYANSLEMAAMLEDDEEICYDYFVPSTATGMEMVWDNFPKAATGKYCADGTDSCSKKEEKTASNIYEVFSLVGFTVEDYTPSEAAMATKLITKMETCAPAKLNARKRQVWGEFLVNTMSGLGQNTNTGSIMDSVQGIANGGGGLGNLSSLGSIAAQFMNK